MKIYVTAYERRTVDDWDAVQLCGWSPCGELECKAAFDGTNYVLSAADYDNARAYFGDDYPYLSGQYEGKSLDYPTSAEVIRGADC